MCTVIFSPQRRGYLLGMNRDEKRARPAALPPSLQRAGTGQAVFPREPGGGTWIATNDLGISFALVNWYSIPASSIRKTITRGRVIPTLIESTNSIEAIRSISNLSLSKMNPFRLTGFFPAERQILEWRWNLKKLECVKYPWKLNAWISSGYDEPGAQQIRGHVLAGALRQKSRGGAAWLRRLHRSHRPAQGPYSICMHREEAVTVSYTEIRVGVATSKMRYTAGPPCSDAKVFQETLGLVQVANNDS